mgnify:CR=1 FL=1
MMLLSAGARIKCSVPSMLLMPGGEIPYLVFTLCALPYALFLFSFTDN